MKFELPRRLEFNDTVPALSFEPSTSNGASWPREIPFYWGKDEGIFGKSLNERVIGRNIHFVAGDAIFCWVIISGSLLDDN